MSSEPRERCGRYELIERIALGGMAEVWRARASAADSVVKDVALKRPLSRYAADDDFRKMFIDEARLAAQVSHPNIAQIFELGEADNRLYIAMELLDGVNLRQLSELFKLRDKPFPAALASYIVSKAAEALYAAHTARNQQGEPLGLVHRDMSPHNVILTRDGDVKIVDFGIARAAQRLSQTQAGVVKGKVRYLSPELLKGHEASPQSDIFALGLIFVELLTGQQVINGSNDLENFKLISSLRATELISRAPTQLGPIGSVLLKMLELEPEKRYRSADDITDELQRHLIRDGGIYGRFQAARHLGEVLPSGSEPTQQGGTDIIAVASDPSLAEPVEVEEPTRFGEVPAVEQSVASPVDTKSRGKDWKNVETHRWDVSPSMLAASRRTSRLKLLGLGLLAATLGAIFIAWVMGLGK